MNTKFKTALAVVVGAALGAAAMQGLHAQAKPKAYTVSELETLDAAAQAAYVPAILAAQKACQRSQFQYCRRTHRSNGRRGAQACRHHGMGQPGAGGGVLQIE